MIWVSFLFGGATRTEQDKLFNPDFADVFILSLPAFHWFRVSNSTTQMRSGHYCQVIGSRQMLVIGGASSQDGVPETWTNGLGIYDMTALKWASGYNANAESYVRPELVKRYYPLTCVLTKQHLQLGGADTVKLQPKISPQLE